MIYVDKRIGSGELAKLLAVFHLPVDIPDQELPYGDMWFMGLGEEGCPTPIGIERKALPDFITSVRSGRLGYQLRGCLQTYRQTWVVVEGLWRPDHKSGLVITPKGKVWKPLDAEIGGQPIMYRELESMFLTVEMKCGTLIRRVTSKHETARFIGALYHWWTDKDFEDHRSHLKFHSASADKALLVEPGTCRAMAACLPGVGWERSGPVARAFGNDAEAMCAAPVEVWATIPVGTDKNGRQLTVGANRAKKIRGAIKGEKV